MPLAVTGQMVRNCHSIEIGSKSTMLRTSKLKSRILEGIFLAKKRKSFAQSTYHQQEQQEI